METQMKEMKWTGMGRTQGRDSCALFSRWEFGAALLIHDRYDYDGAINHLALAHIFPSPTGPKTRRHDHGTNTFRREGAYDAFFPLVYFFSTLKTLRQTDQTDTMT